MMAKNLTLNELIWKIPIRFALDAVSAWKGLLSGDISFFIAIVKAHISFMSQVMTGKVNRSLNPVPMNCLHGVYNGSLVVEYFIKKKQHFNKIVSKLVHY